MPKMYGSITIFKEKQIRALKIASVKSVDWINLAEKRVCQKVKHSKAKILFADLS